MFQKEQHMQRREGERSSSGRSYKYILVELKLRIVSDEAEEAPPLMPGCEQGRSRAAQWPSGTGWRGSLGGGRLGRGSELELRQRTGDGHREPGEQSAMGAGRTG